jgi:hypothetical protein
MGKALLSIFNDEKLHHKYLKWITKWYIYVILYLKNLTQLMALKKVKRSSRKWSPKLASSMASLHRNGLGFQIIQHFVASGL